VKQSSPVWTKASPEKKAGGPLGAIGTTLEKKDTKKWGSTAVFLRICSSERGGKKEARWARKILKVTHPIRALWLAMDLRNVSKRKKKVKKNLAK